MFDFYTLVFWTSIISGVLFSISFILMGVMLFSKFGAEYLTKHTSQEVISQFTLGEAKLAAFYAFFIAKGGPVFLISAALTILLSVF